MIRMLLGGVGVGIAMVGAGGCSGALANTTNTANGAAAGVWVEVSPGTIEAGNSVTVRADCGDNSNPATVSSKAFRSLTLQPWNTLLQGEASVGQTVKTGTYDVMLTCRTGSRATTTLSVLGTGGRRPTVGPHTGGGFLANGSATQEGEPARIWLIAGATALVAAGAAGIILVRRRVPVRNR